MKEVGAWPGCLEDLIKPNQASHQGARWTSSVSMLKVPVLTLIIEVSAVWPWCRRSFQDICRGLDNYSWAYLWLISHDLSHGVPFPSCVLILSVVHIRRLFFCFFCLACHAWVFDFTHINDQHTRLKRIISCILCTYQYHSCLTTFVHGFIRILKLGNY
jgi:hypothetical protein